MQPPLSFSILGLDIIVPYDPYRNRIATWYIFLQCLEASVATITASISAFRLLFALGGLKNVDEKKKEVRPLPPLINEQLLRKNKQSAWYRWDEIGRKGRPGDALVQADRFTSETESVQSNPRPADEENQLPSQNSLIRIHTSDSI